MSKLYNLSKKLEVLISESKDEFNDELLKVQIEMADLVTLERKKSEYKSQFNITFKDYLLHSPLGDDPVDCIHEGLGCSDSTAELILEAYEEFKVETLDKL